MPAMCSYLQVLPGELQLQRQQSDWESMDADVAEESEVNKEVVELVVQRLESGKR